MSRASVKAYRHLATVLAELGEPEPHPKPGSRWREFPPQEFPTKWASSWGQDEFGLWCSFEVDEVEQCMRWIPGGLAKIGSQTEAERRDNEFGYRIQLEGFWLAESTCTQTLWSAITGNNSPSQSVGRQLPVVDVSWENINNQFLPQLRNIIPELDVRLPCEAEWEYACRANSKSPFWWGSKISSELANYHVRGANPDEGESADRGSTIESITLFPNPWGLYQMHGNVWEWCDELWQRNPLQKTPEDSGGSRVVRGGSWNGTGGVLRSAMRSHYTADNRNYDLGFRLVAGSRQTAQPRK